MQMGPACQILLIKNFHQFLAGRKEGVDQLVAPFRTISDVGNCPFTSM